jgi:hypothetical protein
MSVAADISTLDRQYPFLQYAASFWSYHCREVLRNHPIFNEPPSDDPRRFIEKVDKFLSMPLSVMTWIEAIYSYPDGITSILEFHNNLEELDARSRESSFEVRLKGILTPFSEFAADIFKLNKDWGPALNESPNEVWNNVTIFMPSRFLRQNSAGTLQYIPPHSEAPGTEALKPLFACSASSPDGFNLGILSIWPNA